jgi:lipopolysaccharide transport system ATP-binding protein
MSDVAIQVRNISKKYHIGKQINKNRNFREALVDTLSGPFRRAGDLMRGHAEGVADLHDTLWALRDISFDIKRGEVVGIIGRNGAGKSTLLKILSRITEPSSGYADIYGRVGSLLEVGTGFHQELTGRENVYLNGAILGMTGAEIDRKFDEIVAFSEIEKFLDTPVKHYSSGMVTRLAFAVAAHLEPEILIVDEVLAVGDAAFQKKCLNKMQDVGQEGRTVLFVSHSMPAITRLCERTILLESGQVLDDGPSHQVVSSYLNSGLGTTAAREWPDLVKAPGDDVVRLRAVRIRTKDNKVSDALDIRQPVGLEMEYQVLQPDYTFMVYFRVLNEEGIELFITIDTDPTWRQRSRPAGHYVSTAWIPGNLLAEGTFFVGAAIRTVNPTIRRFHAYDAVAFQLIDSNEGDSARGDHTGGLRGVIRPYLEWQTQFNANGHQPVEPLAVEEIKP